MSVDPIEAAENEGMPDAIPEPMPEPRPMKRAETTLQRHEELMEMLGAIFVQLSRIYDASMISLSVVNNDVAEQVADKHEAGKLFGSAPVLLEDAWSDNDPNS